MEKNREVSMGCKPCYLVTGNKVALQTTGGVTISNRNLVHLVCPVCGHETKAASFDMFAKFNPNCFAAV